MMVRTQRRWVATVSSLMAFAVLGCSISGISIAPVEVGRTQRETRVIELGDAESVRANVRMGAGELTIEGDDQALLTADFVYNVETWRPEVEYTETDGDGRLSIQQPATEQLVIRRDTRNTWDLKFSRETPLDMRIDLGAGTSEIDLSNMNLTRLEVKLGAGEASIRVFDNPELSRISLIMGAGNATFDLDGPWSRSADVAIQGGVGRTTVYLPSEVGVRVSVSRGIGSISTSGLFRRDSIYVNAAYDTADVVLDITIQAGVGEINLEVVE